MNKRKIMKMDKDITVGSLEELIKYVRPFQNEGNWFFRGVRQNDYKLRPKIGRSRSRPSSGMGNFPYDFDDEETLIKHFIRTSQPYIQNRPESLLEWLALAQHHGMFTRLLDWSESLLVAAYFAVEDARDRDKSPMIYCVSGIAPASTKPIVEFSQLNNLDDVMLYYPPHISSRIPVQKSIFTIHKQPDKDYEPENLSRITIEKPTLTLKFDLNACGINKASLFPDINGLAEYHSWLYKWGNLLPYRE